MRDRLIADRYRLEERAGAGGMGEVWRATDVELGRVVALKRPNNGDNGQIRREARIGAGLHHPHVVTVFDTVVDGDERWLVMEYLPSRSLAEILETEGPQSPSDVAHIGEQLADALTAMHANGMVHRDIKPGNVLVTADGTAKLTDLGITQWAEVTVTGTDQVCGTPGYLAPEVADGQPSGQASDVFSLGATLYAAVEGTSPWDGALDPSAQLRRAAAYELRPARRAGSLDPVLTQLLRRKPEARPTAAQTRALLSHKTIVPTRPRRAVGVVAAALVLVGGLTYASLASSDTGVTADTTGDPRTADPCSLIHPDWLREFGDAEYERDYGHFNYCSVLVALSDDQDNVVDVRVVLEETDSPPAVAPLPGRLRPPEGPLASNGQCGRVIHLPDGNVITVTATHPRQWYARLCAMLNEVTPKMVEILNRGQIPRRPAQPAPASLAAVRSCDLLGEQTVATALGAKADDVDEGFASWECYWTLGPHEIAIFYDREPMPFDEGEHVRVDDHDVSVEVGKGNWKTACQAEIAHRRFTGTKREWVETVEIFLTIGGTPPEALCEPVTELARAAAANLPKLPG